MSIVPVFSIFFLRTPLFFFFFFFNDTATTEIYTLSLHDALPISLAGHAGGRAAVAGPGTVAQSDSGGRRDGGPDRKSTRLNSSHLVISYAVFCLKKKKKRENKDTLSLQNNNKADKCNADSSKLSR